MTVSEQIDKFIEECGGDVRDALNVALARLGVLEARGEYSKVEMTCKGCSGPCGLCEGLPWSEAPEWAAGAAMDADGDWHWYEERPQAHPRHNLWMVKAGRRWLRIEGVNTPGWKDSWQERPA